MAVRYTVNAEVVDIRKDQPKPEDVFLVDSNVWFWLTYSGASRSSRTYQLRHYPDYLVNALSFKAKLYQCGLSLAELAHRIEVTEHEIFVLTAGAHELKEFRHNYPKEREDVVAEIQSAWAQVKQMSEPLEILVDEQTTDAALARCQAQPLDGYDLLILEAISKAGVTQVLTDDGDFATVSGIKVFTANINVIKTARANGKLVKKR